MNGHSPSSQAKTIYRSQNNRSNNSALTAGFGYYSPSRPNVPCLEFSLECPGLPQFLPGCLQVRALAVTLAGGESWQVALGESHLFFAKTDLTRNIDCLHLLMRTQLHQYEYNYCSIACRRSDGQRWRLRFWRETTSGKPHAFFSGPEGGSSRRSRAQQDGRARDVGHRTGHLNAPSMSRIKAEVVAAPRRPASARSR